MRKYKIQVLVERLFVLAGLIILLMTLIAGFYFNHYDAIERQKESIEKSHAVLSQLVIPSLVISDVSEIRHLLYMASGKGETYLVVTKNNTVIMSDYGVTDFSSWVSNLKLENCRGLEYQYRKINGVNYLVDCSELRGVPQVEGNKNLGVLLSFTQYRFFQVSFLVFYLFVVLVLIFLIMIFVFRKIIYYRLIRPLLILKDEVISVSVDNELSVVALNVIADAPVEVTEIKDAFQRLLNHLQLEYSRRVETEKIKALVDLAAGVAHDIRSPVVALDMITKDIQSLPEEQRLIIRHAATRIKDIANNLLSQYRERNSDTQSLAASLNAELISDLLSSLLSEKRVQYRYHPIQFLIEMDENSYGQFSFVDVMKFNRILSNIIDNSIEANASSLKIQLSKIDNQVQSKLKISVIDDGSGMPESILEKIKIGIGVTSKINGHGLGLIQAIKAIESDWNGEMKVESRSEMGTKIDILLPEAKCPSWFLQELKISSSLIVVIVDDDESIHQVWKERFKKLDIELTYVDYYCPEDLMQSEFSKGSPNCIYLIDYEFINSRQTGFELVSALNLSGLSYLVTSRHESLKLQEAVAQLGIKIIPKTYAANIPIRLIETTDKKFVDAVFIDNDSAIRSAWLFRAKLKGVSLDVYSSVHQFKVQMESYQLNTLIYIDSRLGEGVVGEDFARFLYDFGFKNIILTTAHHPDSFSKMNWISNIIGKEPPF